MTLLLDILFVRRPLTPTEFVAALIVWLMLAVVVSAFVLRSWLTESDLEHVEDDDLDYLRVERGEIR